jgi:hypothetical protein
MRDSKRIPPVYTVMLGLQTTSARLLKPWRWRQYVPPKRWYLPTSTHGITSQNTNSDIVKFQVLTAKCMKMTFLWDVAPCSLVDTDRHFRGAIIALMMEAVSSSETSVTTYQTASQRTAIFYIDSFTVWEPQISLTGLVIFRNDFIFSSVHATRLTYTESYLNIHLLQLIELETKVC